MNVQEEDNLYIVIWRAGEGKPWQAAYEGVHSSRRLADNHMELQKVQKTGLEYAIVEGPIVSPAQMAEAEATVGA
jgi:hypothetical protein